MEWNWCQVSVTKLLSSSFPEVALLAAMLLSNCQLERDTCVTTLLTYLSSTNPTWRDQVDSCHTHIVETVHYYVRTYVCTYTINWQPLTSFKISMSICTLVLI